MLSLGLGKPEKVVEEQFVHVLDGKPVDLLARPVEHDLSQRSGFGEYTELALLVHFYTS
ncbi:hypothetical protein SDC9_208157 [bioreactor metagenome]|uniref:Uncharacterized protein n=1 Tax=bioreactor metagenome TaxID=1076179 RepID=A0A645JCF7_9ZZZZ